MTEEMDTPVKENNKSKNNNETQKQEKIPVKKHQETLGYYEKAKSRKRIVAKEESNPMSKAQQVFSAKL